MKTVVLTTRGNQFAGVFYRAYLDAGGTAFQAVLFLPDRREVGFHGWAKVYAAWKLLGLRGTVGHLRTQWLPWLASPRERALGLNSGWKQLLPRLSGDCRNVSAGKGGSLVSVLRDLQPDVLVSVGAPVIFKQEVLSIPRYGALNVHNGRVPKYRGHFATFWEVLNGEEQSCTCVHEMLEKVDSGRLLAKAAIRLAEASSFRDLLVKKKVLGGRLLAALLAEIEVGGKLPERDLSLPEDRANSAYFGFPGLPDLKAFHWQSRA